MYYWVQNFGWSSMLGYYFVPYLWVNQYVFALILLTLIQQKLIHALV